MDWQPIENAPKDGSRVLLIDMSEGGSAEVCWGEWRVGGGFIDGVDVWVDQWRDFGDMGCNGQCDYEPTHWMPLPAPPA